MPGIINVDFADVRAIMQSAGSALMGIGSANGENRAIEAAKNAFETNRKTINEVMYDVGYSDMKAFREIFKRITGMSPLEYRGRYNKEAEAKGEAEV
jgi:hypothetical protein